jgi:hypothetical protein
MAGVLKVTSNGTTTSPVLRGAWVMDRILGTPPPPPPDNVSAIDPDIRGAKAFQAAGNVDRFVKRRTQPSCSARGRHERSGQLKMLGQLGMHCQAFFWFTSGREADHLGTASPAGLAAGRELPIFLFLTPRVFFRLGQFGCDVGDPGPVEVRRPRSDFAF